MFENTEKSLRAEDLSVALIFNYQNGNSESLVLFSVISLSFFNDGPKILDSEDSLALFKGIEFLTNVAFPMPVENCKNMRKSAFPNVP